MTQMMTVEKLLAQIFERKNRIIQQVKQQTDIYTQHLASKCLVDGVTPPPWLWNDNQSCDDPKELNKEDIISEILLPHPRPPIRFPSACCSLYNAPVAREDKEELVDGFFKETCSYNKCSGSGDKQAIAASHFENSTGCTMIMVPDLGVSVTSPQDETEVRMSNICSAPDQSVARIQRSKSRQKALELRNSAKASSRSRLNLKNCAVGSPPRSGLSMFSSEQDQVMGSQGIGEPCVMSHGSCGNGESNEQDNENTNKEKGITFSTGTVRRSRSSGEQSSSVKDFQKGDSFIDYSQKSDTSLGKDVHHFRQCLNVVNVSPKVINSDVTAESGGFIEERTSDHFGHKEKGTNIRADKISRTSFSSHQPCFLNETPEVDVSVHSDMVDGGITAKSDDKSVQQFDDANDFLELSKHPVGLVRKRTRSLTTSGDGGIPMLLNTSNVAHHRDTRSISVAIEKCQAAKYEVENGSDDILPFPDSCDANRLGNFEIVIGDDPVKDKSANSRSTLDDAGLESFLTKSFSDYVVLMDPKQLVFDDREECNLKDKFRPTVEYKSLEKSPDNVFDNSIRPASSLDYQGSSGYMISKNLSTVEPEVTKEEDINRGSFESNNEDVDVQIKQKQSDAYEDSTLNTFAFNSENVLHVPNLKFTCLANIMDPNVVESPHAENPMNIYSEEVCERELHKEGDYSYKAKERSPCASHPSESKHFSRSDFSRSGKKAIGVSEDCSIKEVENPASTDFIIDAAGQHRLQENQNLLCVGAKLYSGNSNNEKILESSSLGGNDLLMHGSVGFLLGDHENLDLSKSRELQIEKKPVVLRKLRSVEVESWPQNKRRKIQDQEADSFSASPSFRVIKHYPSEMDSISMNLKKDGNEVETIPGNESTKMEVYQKMGCHLIEEFESSSKLQSEKNILNLEGLGEHAEISLSSELKQLGEPVVSNLIKDPYRVSQECLIEEMNLAGTSSDAGKETGEDDHQYLLHHEGGDNFAYSEGLVIESKSYLGVDGQLSCGLGWSPTKKDLDLTGAGEMMPVFESFIIDPQTESEEVNISGHGVNLDKFEFPRTSVERASILEQMCKSTVMQTPSMQFSSAFKLHGSQKFCHSVPNGLLECMDLRNISALNEDVHKQLRAIYGNSSNGNLQKISYSDCLPYSGARFSWDSRNIYASPVGKLWERTSLRTGSSEKRLSSNPELTCFPIEEDPSTSEEKENTSDEPDQIQVDIGLVIDNSAERQRLADITEANVATSFSATENFVNRASADLVTTEVSFEGAHKKVKQKLQNYSRNKLLIAVNGIKKAKESTSSKLSKANSSCKTSLKTEMQKLSLRKPKCNNIVSNVTSFIPLVQQKQTAAVCTGKRDVKVKALEAAEVAKRFEEKRQNERKMRKEALKLERARMEQENLRQMELNKKKKEEERRKREGDIVAKKRLREEEERKQRKKRQTEEARRRQREESTLCSQKGERDNKMKQSGNLLKKSQTLVKESRDDVTLEKPETKQRLDEFAVDFQQAGISTEACGTSGDPCQLEKAMPALDTFATKDNLVIQKSPEKSYDISPYLCSDEEEDDEEENIPKKKFIPSWASKNCVALVLPMQQRVDPDVIFPLAGFCRIDEVYPSPKANRIMTKKGQR